MLGVGEGQRPCRANEEVPFLADAYRILIVDDEDINRLLLADMLDCEGWIVDKAAHGLEAWDLVQKQDYHLVITDIKMPFMDGIELLGKIKNEHPTLPVVVVTAFASVDTAIEALRLGAFNFLRKPFSIEEIQSIARKGLALWDVQQERSRILAHVRKHIEIRIPSDPSLINSVFHHVHEDALALGFPHRVVHMNLYLALSEALANAIDHGNDRRAGSWVDVDIHLSPEEIRIRIQDEGKGFQVEEVPDPTTSENLFKSRGRGIFLMRCYMDEVRYNEKGNGVLLVKRREEKSEAEEG